MKSVYIASSWKNRHAVEMLSTILRSYPEIEVKSFVENCFNEMYDGKPFDFETWVHTPDALKSFTYDIHNAMGADLVIYIGPSGPDAWAEIGAAYGNGVMIVGLHAKGETIGLMRKMIPHWFSDHKSMLKFIEDNFFTRP